MGRLDFDLSKAPWSDRDTFSAEADRRQAAGTLTAEDRARLDTWRTDGYLTFPKLVEPAAIDALLAAYEDGWRTRPDVSLLVEGEGSQPWKDVAPRDTLVHHHYRVLDFQDVSSEARAILFHPEIVRALHLIFDQPPVAMQSLFFEYSSEQRTHQDFPYVQAQELSHLIGCWVACEDTGPDNGPLFYYPGSQRLPKFDWGGGALAWGGQDLGEVERFEDQLQAACEAAGLERKVLHAKKGDVLLWHSALAHGGSPVHDRSLTRKSFVAHYSTREGYPRDRRWPEADPVVETVGGGYFYRPPTVPVRGLVSRLRSAAGRVVRGLRGR